MASIMQVMAAAKRIMRSSGNMHQWTGNYPSESVILGDMAREGAYVVTDDDVVVAYFAFLPSPDPTYAHIYDGAWLDDSLPYHVIHRMASYPQVHHIFTDVMNHCFSTDPNIRMDTHRDNTIMQHLITTYGFSYCGIIYLANGDERKAYQKIQITSEDLLTGQKPLTEVRQG